MFSHFLGQFVEEGLALIRQSDSEAAKLDDAFSKMRGRHERLHPGQSNRMMLEREALAIHGFISLTYEQFKTDLSAMGGNRIQQALARLLPLNPGATTAHSRVESLGAHSQAAPNVFAPVGRVRVRYQWRS